MPDTELIEQLTRGFSGLRDEFKKRDESAEKLSGRLELVEYKVGEQNRILGLIQEAMAKTETVQIKMRIDALEKAQGKVEQKQTDNAKWIKGMIASVIILALGVLFNLLRIGLK